MLYQKIKAATFVSKGSHNGQAISNDGFFFYYQLVVLVATFRERQIFY